MKKRKNYQKPIQQVVRLHVSQQLLVNSATSTMGNRQNYTGGNEDNWN